MHNPPVLTLERFLPYRLSIMSNRVSSLIADAYKDKFAISVTEWRIMAVLGEYPGLSADEVATKTQIDKSLISRAVSKLLKRHLIDREVAEDDRRRSVLKLSATGQDVYREIVPLSYQYEQSLLACFSEQEQAQLSEWLDRLYAHACQLTHY